MKLQFAIGACWSGKSGASRLDKVADIQEAISEFILKNPMDNKLLCFCMTAENEIIPFIDVDSIEDRRKVCGFLKENNIDYTMLSSSSLNNWWFLPDITFKNPQESIDFLSRVNGIDNKYLELCKKQLEISKNCPILIRAQFKEKEWIPTIFKIGSNDKVIEFAKSLVQHFESKLILKLYYHTESNKAVLNEIITYVHRNDNIDNISPLWTETEEDFINRTKV